MNKVQSERMPRGTGCILVFFSFVTLGMGYLAASMFVLEPLARQKEAAFWQEVPCVIREIGVERHTLRGSRSTRSSTAYGPKVEYEYSYGNQTYTSQVFWFSHRLLNTKEEVQQLIAGYEVGGISTCWVNPKQPTDAVLNRDNPGISVAGGIFGGIIMFIGSGGLCGSLWLIFKYRR